jgi:radical SAM protein with 4Fe4S-binding SPASM domain
MTYQCNARCRYCYNIKDRDQWVDDSDKNRTTFPDLTFEEYKKLVQEGKKLRVKKFLLTGGEPLLNPISLELANYISEQGLETEILTNGLLINETNAKAIAETFNIISISLDSLKKESHEEMRGKNTFDRVMESIKLLKAHGAYIRITTIITKANVNDVLDTWLEVYDNLKCDIYTPALYVPDSNDPEIYGPFLPKMEDLMNEQDRIRDHFKDMPGIAFKPANIRFSCGVGNGEISVSPDGIVFPCHTLHKPELQCGNLREQGLEQIIKESKLLHQMRQLNINKIDLCSKCDYKYLCAGGCTAMNYNIYGDFYTRNEFYCDYLKQEQVERMWAFTTEDVKTREPGAEGGHD